MPSSSLYVPATHCVHSPPSDPDEPALQTQSVFSSLAAGPLELDGHPWHTLVVALTSVENLPAMQLVQSAFPDAILYFPATHPVHGPPSDPDEPAGHGAVCLVRNNFQ